MNRATLTTSYRLLVEHHACQGGLRLVREHLESTARYHDSDPFDLPIPLRSGIAICGPLDVFWALRATHQDASVHLEYLRQKMVEKVAHVWRKGRHADSLDITPILRAINDNDADQLRGANIACARMLSEVDSLLNINMLRILIELTGAPLARRIYHAAVHIDETDMLLNVMHNRQRWVTSILEDIL